MKTPDWYVFKDFVDCLPSEQEKKAVLHYLTPDEQEDIHLTPPLSLHPSHGLSTYEKRLQSIHYSWFIPLLQRLCDTDKYLLMAPLHAQKEALYTHFELTRAMTSLTPLALEFVSCTLYEHLIKDFAVVLPKECLPDDPLNALLTLSREQLLHLVDLLSLHDLSLEMKTMINSAQLLKIEAMLSHQQKDYLYALKRKIEPIAFKPIGLSHWNGDELLLKKILHQRGLNRLSKALSASHHSLIWHLSHQLDMGRASIVKTLVKRLNNKKAHAVLVAQVCELITAI